MLEINGPYEVLVLGFSLLLEPPLSPLTPWRYPDLFPLPLALWLLPPYLWLISIPEIDSSKLFLWLVF